MGGCAGKAAPNDVVQPQNQRQQRIAHQFAQFARLDHPLNVNHKYTSFFTIVPDQYIGEGIKKTNQYQTRLSKDEWLGKRTEFWETRIEGRQENWQAIKTACTSDEETAIAILQASELKLINKSLQLLYDNQGHKYDVPVFCINEPVSFAEKHSSEMGINNEFQEQELKIKIRSAKLPQDFLSSVSNKTTVVELKSILSEHQKFGRVRFFYGGREMQDHHQLGNYNLPPEPVIQAFCTD